MKQFLSIQLTKKEKIVLAIIFTWITAAFFVPLPEVNSLGM
jgi:hypothetical protein